MRWQERLLLGLIGGCLASPGMALAQPAGPDVLALRRAIAKSLPLLQSGAKAFLERAEGNCISCHHQGLILGTTALARSRGFEINEAWAQAQVRRIHLFYTRKQPLYAQALHDPDALNRANSYGNLNVYLGYFLTALADEYCPPDEALHTAALLLTRTQWPDGHWGYEDTGRVPVQSSDFATTALALKVLQDYGPKQHAAVLEASTARAKAWLRAHSPRTTDDKAFRLLGLVWMGATPDEIQAAAAQLRGEQRTDGGWAQQENMPSDAYATGLVLAALHQAGTRPFAEPAGQRGLSYLLQHQGEDGSWFVRTRAIPSNAYFESGFPHGKSQFISYAASCWATRALLLALEPPQ